MRYLWQAKQWQQLWQANLKQRLPHAILLSGIEGIGKLDFALHLAQALLCSEVNSVGDPCNECHACRLVLTHAHPNIKQLEPEKPGHAIKVDQVREIGEFVQQSSFQGEYRFAIINPAHSMNMNSANALLKTLEEPAEGAIIILISDRSGHLPATIRSRCHKILFSQPDKKLAVEWLQSQRLEGEMPIEQRLRLSYGAPLLAANLQNDDALSRSDFYQALLEVANKKSTLITHAAKWQKADPIRWIDLFFNWVSDLVKVQLGAKNQFILNQDYLNELNETAKLTNLNNNLRMTSALLKARKQIANGVNFNKQLLFESTLIKWLEPKHAIS